MNKNIAKMWAKALKSNKYTQGKYKLCRVVRSHPTEETQEFHCCLGVLCELAVLNGVHVEVRANTIEKFFNLQVSVLPQVVQEWAEMKDCVGTLPQEHSLEPQTLVTLNDSPSSTFADIAEIITEEWETL